jgi:hypothetical protein
MGKKRTRARRSKNIQPFSKWLGARGFWVKIGTTIAKTKRMHAPVNF